MNTERDELAREIFRVDNAAQLGKDNQEDWDALCADGRDNYAHHIADGLLAAGYRKQVSA